MQRTKTLSVCARMCRLVGAFVVRAPQSPVFSAHIFVFIEFAKLCIPIKTVVAREDDRPWYEFDMNWNSRKRGKQEETALKLGILDDWNTHYMSQCMRFPTM